MIVYREQRRRAEPARLLRELGADVAGLGARPDHDAVVGALIDLGTIEAAVVDALHPFVDDESPVTRRFREAARAAGHLLLRSWRAEHDALGRWRDELELRIRLLQDLPLPPTCEIRVPEGYAQYGVFPEAYLEAAGRLMRELQPRRAVCLGVRTIGTSLSAAVVASLEADGCAVESHTVRPHGHPFDRRPTLGPVLAGSLARAAGDSHLVLVDEGPGISGSSLAGLAETLARLGAPDDRIVLLPSWNGDGSDLRAEVARRRWPRHRRFVAEFDDVWLRSRRLPLATCDGAPQDLSAGRWRPLLLPESAPWPAVHPQHERRKLLAHGTIYTFAGLGRFGRGKLERMADLARAGFSPAPMGLERGFLRRELLPGTPLRPGHADAALLDRVARYLAHLRRHHAREEVEGTPLLEMIETNIGEAVGPDAARAALERLRRQGFPGDAPPVAVDGRMFPHEWLRTLSGYLKVDGTDHHDDHFFPGCTDIAWDLAGTAVEFGLGRAERTALVEDYQRLSADATIVRRVPGFAIAYLAFRIGYAALAVETLAGSDDARRFAAQGRRYRVALSRELGTPARAPTVV